MFLVCGLQVVDIGGFCGLWEWVAAMVVGIMVVTGFTIVVGFVGY